MKILRSKESIATALLMLLSLSAIAGMTALVDAAPIKADNVYIIGSGSVELTWKSGNVRIFSSNGYASLGGLYNITFIPTHGWHIIQVLIDGNSEDIADEDGFSIINPKVKSMISVAFLENPGIDDVETGSSVEAYPDPYVGLIFDNVLTGGDAYAYTIGLPPPNATGETWDIYTDAIFNQSILIIIVLPLADAGPDPQALKMLRTEYWLALADVNVDGVVDGTDESIVANANPSEFGDPDYVPRLDQNSDNRIDNEDVNIVNDYIGETVWEDITVGVVVDYDLGIVKVYGVTDHLSLFGIH